MSGRWRRIGAALLAALAAATLVATVAYANMSQDVKITHNIDGSIIVSQGTRGCIILNGRTVVDRGRCSDVKITHNSDGSITVTRGGVTITQTAGGGSSVSRSNDLVVITSQGCVKVDDRVVSAPGTCG